MALLVVFLNWCFLKLAMDAVDWSWICFGFARLEKGICPTQGAGVASSGIIF
jgi:hypothetical protein